MKVNEIFNNVIVEKDEYADMTPDALKSLYDHTLKTIKKKSDDKGWYGGVSGTEFFNRDWKKELTAEKKKAALIKKHLK